METYIAALTGVVTYIAVDALMQRFMPAVAIHEHTRGICRAAAVIARRQGHASVRAKHIALDMKVALHPAHDPQEPGDVGE